MSKIKAALFDLDGTLFDTQKFYDEAHQKMINTYGNKKKFTLEAKMKINGTPAKVANKYICDLYGINLSAEEYQEKKHKFLSETLKNTGFLPGVKELLETLRYKYNFKIAIATSSSKGPTDLKLSNYKTFIDSAVDLIITGDDKRIKKGKPNPDIFLLAAKELGVDPKECIIFEDSVLGVEAALKTGASIVVAIPVPIIKPEVERIEYDKDKVKLCILDSMKEFDYGILK